MIICICNNLDEKDLHSAVDQGYCTVAQVAKCKGIAYKCGQCKMFMLEEIKKAELLKNEKN